MDGPAEYDYLVMYSLHKYYNDGQELVSNECVAIIKSSSLNEAVLSFEDQARRNLE